jgi:hypothetical protein
MERRGIPAAVVGVEKLLMTTGRGMARAQGYPDLPVATFKHEAGIMTAATGEDAMHAAMVDAAAQVEDIVLRPDVPRKLSRNDGQKTE